MSKKEAVFDQPSSLMLTTLHLMQGCDLLELYAETKISYHWLRKFVMGAYQNPSVNRVQYLYEHLSKGRLL